MSKLIDQIRAAYRVSVPLVAVSTPDPAATIAQIAGALPAQKSASTAERPSLCGESLCVEWDLLRGYHPLGGETQREAFHAWLVAADVNLESLQFNPELAVASGLKLPPGSVLFIHLANRCLERGAPFIQAVWNLRDAFKATGRMLVLLGPALVLPPELAGDVLALDEPLPDRVQLSRIVQEMHEAADVTEIAAGTIDRAVDAVQGLPAFAAEQVVAMSLKSSRSAGTGGKKVVALDLASLWERKRQQIEQTPGLKVWRGGERFDDIGGVAVVKDFLARIMTGCGAKEARPNAVVFIDEIEKMMAGAMRGGSGGGDTSGVSQDQLGSLLAYMQDTSAAGMIFVGPPGSAKSMVAKAAGNCDAKNTGGVPTIQLDLGAAKGSLVGQSEQQLRTALKVVTAVAAGKSLWIATCNQIADLPPELRRRFTLGTFFFDLPTAEERTVIWRIWLAKYELGKYEPGDLTKLLHVDDRGWTGAEIRQCCEIAWRLGVTLKEASAFIVPVSRSASEQLERLRSFAKGRFLSASRPGVYAGPEEERSACGASGARSQESGAGKAKRRIATDE